MTHASTGATAGAPVQQTGEVYPRGGGKSKDRNYASGEDIYKVQKIALILHFLAFALRRRRLARARDVDSVLLSDLRSMTIRSLKP